METKIRSVFETKIRSVFETKIRSVFLSSQVKHFLFQKA